MLVVVGWSYFSSVSVVVIPRHSSSWVAVPVAWPFSSPVVVFLFVLLALLVFVGSVGRLMVLLVVLVFILGLLVLLVCWFLLALVGLCWLCRSVMVCVGFVWVRVALCWFVLVCVGLCWFCWFLFLLASVRCCCVC